VCDIKVQCKEVKKRNKFIYGMILLIERHVSAYSEAIIRFNSFQLYETNIFHGIMLLDVEISSSMFVWQCTEKKTMRSVATKYPGKYVPGRRYKLLYRVITLSPMSRRASINNIIADINLCFLTSLHCIFWVVSRR